MEVIADIAPLAEALADVTRAIPSRGYALPVLSGVHISASEDHLLITGTDLDVTVQRRVPAQVVKPGVALVPGKLFKQIVGDKRSKDCIELRVDEGTLHSLNGIDVSLRMLPVDDYPRLPEVPEGARLPLDLRAIAEVAMAASSEDSRPILTGVLFEGNRMVATDSYRLHLADVPFEVDYPRFNVPARALDVAIKVAGRKFDKPASIRFLTGDKHHAGATIWVGDTVIHTRLIEGEFPNYRQLVPTSMPFYVEFDRKLFLEKLGRVKLLVRDTTTPVRLYVDGSKLTLKVVTQDVGEAKATIACVSESQALSPESEVEPSATIAFNPTYLADVIDLPADRVRIEFVDALKPAMATCTDATGVLHRRLLMPVRVP